MNINENDSLDAQAIKNYLKEKEQIRQVIGAIGGKSNKWEKGLNVIFLLLVGTAFGFGIYHGLEEPGLLSIEIAILLVSLKLAFLMHQTSKVNHFLFWMLSSIEWRISSIEKNIIEEEKELRKIAKAQNDLCK